MEYVQGQSLAQLAAASTGANPPPNHPARWLSLIAAIADALTYAHRQGVIHLDLKPGNIMIGETGQPRIVDFGIARLMSDEATLNPGHAASLTLAHSSLAGTIGYMSPEQAEGTRGDTRSDLYALGLILYELLTSTRAFITSGLSLPAALALVRTQHPRPIQQLASHCCADTCAIVAKAIDKNPEQRYATMAQFAADIRHILADEPISIRPPTLWSLTRRALARHRFAAGAAALLVIALIGNTGLWLRTQAEIANAANTSRQAVGVLLSSIIEPSSPLIGTNEARTRVLAELAPTLAEFASQHPSDTAVQSQYAHYLELLADAQLERGLIDAALPARQQVLEIRTRLAEAAPTDPAAQTNLATALIKWGDIIGAKGNRTQSIELYERALAVQEPILEQRPSDLHALSDVAWSCQRLSEWHRRLGNEQRAITLEQRHEMLSRTMLALAPDNADALSLLSAALIARNGEAFARRDYSTCVALLTEARTAVARLREIAPDHRIYELRWLSVLQGLAAAERHGISDAAGLARLNEAITHARTLVQPTDADSQHQLASLLLAQAITFLGIHQADNASVPLAEAIAITRPLAAASPASPTVTTSHTLLLACALAQQGHLTGVPPVDESIALFEQLIAASPEDPAIKSELATALAIAASQPARGHAACYELAGRACTLDQWSRCHILTAFADAARRANQTADAIKRLTRNLPADEAVIVRREATFCMTKVLETLNNAPSEESR
jgi:tetratricopeptide (TPR) repeat protein